jgi:proteasome lid subunit RPN8/RPN11
MALLRRRPRQQPGREVAPPVLPATVILRPEVIRTIGDACAGAGRLETGGPLIGTVQRSWEPEGERLLVAILGTVSPSSSMRARRSSVALGAHADGERAASALRWWRSVTGIDLVHVGDWHRHPSGPPEPSTGDVLTARRMYENSGVPIWLSAIAVGEDRRVEEIETKANAALLSAERDSCQEVRFYREVGRSELAAVPVLVEGAALPRLPALSWHVADPLRFAVECRLLDAAGFKTAISVDGTSGLELRIARNGRAVTARTRVGYPAEEPTLVDERGLRIRGRGWSSDRFLIDLVRQVCG